MASIRRSMSSVQRDGAGENGEATLDHSPSPKLFRTRGYLAFCRLLVASISSLDFPMVLNRIRATIASFFLPRVSLSSEKMKPKGLLWKRAFIHFSLCFMIGIFIGFTPFISVDFSKNLMSKHQTFSFEVDLPANNAGGLTDIVRNEDLLADNLTFKENVSLRTIPRWETRRETLGTSGLPPPLHDLDIVYRKLLIIVTPTYARSFQAHYLSRLAHTLRVVPPPLLWIVVEMSSPSSEIAEILRGSGVMYRHLVCNKNISHIKDRGIHQRNVALSHIEKHQLDGMVYFADDNNVYSVDLFEQMRGIRRFGTWPVATLMENKKQVSLEGPICNGSQVIGWHTNERNRMGQRFHADMSGFAFNSTILWDPKGWHRPILESIRHLDTVKKGLQVSTFIEQLVEDESQMEGSPKDCSRIMVWHLNLEAPELFYPQGWTIWKNLEVVVPLT